MTAKQAKKLKKGDKVVLKHRKCFNSKPEVTAVEYVSYNADCMMYFIATTDGWGGYHKSMDLVETI